MWREGLDYVHQHRVDFFVGFIARDAARLRLVDADPDDALTMFDAAIDAFQQAGNVAQLTITLASATALFERIEQARQCGHPLRRHRRASRAATTTSPSCPSSPVASRRSWATTRFAAHGAAGAAMDLGDTAQFARREIQRARAELRAHAATGQHDPAGSARREVDVLRLAAQGLTTREIAERLFISAKTADRHIQNLYTKIGASNRAGATRWAVEHGLVD